MNYNIIYSAKRSFINVNSPETDSTLIRWVCATSVLNLLPCSEVENQNVCLVLELPCIVLYCIVLYCIVLYCIVLYCIVLYSIVLYCIVLYRIVSYRIVSYRIVSYRIVSYRIVLYCIGDKYHIYALLNQMILSFHFSSTMFVRKSFKFSITATSLSYSICSDFQN